MKLSKTFVMRSLRPCKKSPFVSDQFTEPFRDSSSVSGRPVAVLNQAATLRQDSRCHENDQHADPQQAATPQIEVRGNPVPRHASGATRADLKSERQGQPQESELPPPSDWLGAKPPDGEPEDERDQHNSGEYAQLSCPEIANLRLEKQPPYHAMNRLDCQQRQPDPNDTP
jgi:hypothetical protein